MELTRLRQTYGDEKAVLRVDYKSSTYIPYTPIIQTRSGLGVTKSTYDSGVAARSRFRGPQKQYLVNKFLPFKVSMVQLGNSRFNGVGYVFAPTINQRTWRDIEYSGNILGVIDNSQGCPYPIGDDPDFLTIDKRIGESVLANAASKTSDAVYDLGVTLAELAETAAMLALPVAGVSKLADKLLLAGGHFWKHPEEGLLFKPAHRHRRRTRYGRKALKAGYRIIDESSNFWLTWRFGVRPLLGDIDNLLGMDFDKFSSPEPMLSHARHVSMNATSEYANGYQTASYFGVQIRDVHRMKSYHSATVKYRRQHGAGFDDFLTAFGLNWQNLPSVMWELVPCSFVIDRFVDIGSWIKNICPDPKVKILDTSVSHSMHCWSVRKFTGGYYKYPTWKLNIDWEKTRVNPFRTYYIAYTREVGNSIPILPTINPRLLNLQQQLDHLTLFWQRLPKWR